MLSVNPVTANANDSYTVLHSVLTFFGIKIIFKEIIYFCVKMLTDTDFWIQIKKTRYLEISMSSRLAYLITKTESRGIQLPWLHTNIKNNLFLGSEHFPGNQ